MELAMENDEARTTSRESLLERLQGTLDKLQDLDQLEEAVKAVEKAVTERETRQPALIRQLAFYFSDANLRRDRFLREKIVSANDGFVPISVILPFNRLKLMGCTTPAEISAAVEAADPKFNLELSEQRDAIRRSGNAEPPPLSFGGAGSDFERRCVQLGGFPKGEAVTIEGVTALVERFGTVAFVRLLRESGPSAGGGPNPFSGNVEIEFQTAEAATALVALEEPLSWEGKALDPARQLSEMRREREESQAKRKNESFEEDQEEKRRRVEDDATEVAKSFDRGLVLRFDEVPSSLRWKDFKEGLRPYGWARFVSLKDGHALVQMRDEEGVFAVMGCASEDEGFLCLQCYPQRRAKEASQAVEAEVEAEVEADDEEEKVAALVETGDGDEDLPLSEALKVDVPETGDEAEAKAEETEAKSDAKEAPEKALGEDDSVEQSVTFRLPVRKVTGDEEEEFLKQAAVSWLQTKGSSKGKGKGKKGKFDKGKDGKGKSKGKGKGKKGKGKGKDR